MPLRCRERRRGIRGRAEPNFGGERVRWQMTAGSHLQEDGCRWAFLGISFFLHGPPQEYTAEICVNHKEYTAATMEINPVLSSFCVALSSYVNVMLRV